MLLPVVSGTGSRSTPSSRPATASTAASTAMFLGRKYSVITTLDRAVPLIEDRLKLAGPDARCASVRVGGIAGLDEEIRKRAGVPVVDGVAAAVTIAESLGGCG